MGPTLSDQVTWGRQNPPVFIPGNDTHFKFEAPFSRKIYAFEDAQLGSQYWEDIFRRFPDMTYWVPQFRKSFVVDFKEPGGHDGQKHSLLNMSPRVDRTTDNMVESPRDTDEEVISQCK